ncbi:hypothetical protein SKAU_G00241530 [Synaphobranchus kaupii]|uniref:Uncharacterized protein n=1 Tax=Synaphobranchus kaupii TaxID=118154 RepID=A0A9Q1ITX7_SYNKA|nr:hypothetical protein SKAU_G00241530 [Synaphobranchus kaupii]
MVWTLVKLSLASCTDGEYLKDIQTLQAAVKCPGDCNATSVERKCCLGMNVTSAEACTGSNIIDGLKSLKKHLGSNSNGRCTQLRRRFMHLLKTGGFDLTCKRLISPKDFLDLLKNAFQQLCNNKS